MKNITEKLLKNFISTFVYIIIFIIAFLIVAPGIFMIAGSFMSQTQLLRIFSSGNIFDLRIIPVPFTLAQYTKGLIENTKYINGFWNSIIISFPVAIIQTLLAFTASWGLAKYKLPFSNIIFSIYIIIFLTPYQVLQVPHYIMMKQFNLLGTLLSIILPNIFSVLGVCLMMQFMKSIPDEIVESAMLEGCGTLKVLYYIVFHLSKPIIACTFILVFIDNWNLVEQPFIFLNNDTGKYPLSVLLSVVAVSDIYTMLVFAILYTIPVILLYLLGGEYLSDSLSIGVTNISGGRVNEK